MNTIPTPYTYWMFNVLQSNSLMEWSFRKAIIIRTFSNYHPIPVPLNLLSQLGMLLIQCIGFCRRRYGSRNCYSQIPDSGKTSGEYQAGEEKVWWGLNQVEVSLWRPVAYSVFSRFKRELEGVYTAILEKMLVNSQIYSVSFPRWDEFEFLLNKSLLNSTSAWKRSNTREQSKNGATRIIPCCLPTKWFQRRLVLVKPA